MKVQKLKDIQAFAGEMERVHTAGWIRTIRQSKTVYFIELHDGTELKTTQCVVNRDEAIASLVDTLTLGSCIRVTGRCVILNGANQRLEIHVEEIQIEGIADADFPLQKKRHGFEYLRTIPHLRGRTNTFNAVFRTRSVMSFAMQKFLEEEDFVYLQSPAITTTDAEGGGEVFRITTLDPVAHNKGYTDDFFKKEAFLSVTGQLNLEPFIASFRNVYTFGPSFRAEKSNTSRHVAEFWQIEPEMAFVGLTELMTFIEKMIKYVIGDVLDQCKDEMAFFESYIEAGLIDKLKKTIQEPFHHITYKDAVDLLSKEVGKFKVNPTWESGLHSEHEHYLSEIVFKKPIFVTDYPKEQKAFYMHLNEDGKTVAACDLLFPKIGEVVGASEREMRYDVLQDRIIECGLEQASYQWYLDTRRFGTCQHSGFGIGIERLLRYISGMENIRDVIAYPRTPGSAEF